MSEAITKMTENPVGVSLGEGSSMGVVSGASASEARLAGAIREQQEAARAAFLAISGREKLTPDEEIAVRLGIKPSKKRFEEAREKNSELTWDGWVSEVTKRHLTSQFEAAKASNPQLTWEDFLKNTLPTLEDSKKAIIAAGVMPMGGGARGYDFEPGHDHPSEWFWSAIGTLVRRSRYYDIPQWSPTRTEQRLEPFEELNPDWLHLTEARILVHNVALAMEEFKPPAEVAALVEKEALLLYLDVLFSLPGVANAWMEYAARGNVLIDRIGFRQSVEPIHNDVRNNIQARFNAQRTNWLNGTPDLNYWLRSWGNPDGVPFNPNIQEIVRSFTLDDAQSLGYELWIFMQEKAARKAMVFARILDDPNPDPATNRSRGWESLYGDSSDRNFPLGDVRVGYPERAWNDPQYHVLFPFAKWQVYSMGEVFGWEYQRFLYKARYSSGISPLITRRKEDIAEAYGNTMGSAWRNGIFAMLQAARVPERDLYKRYIQQCLGMIHLGGRALNVWGEEVNPDAPIQGGAILEDVSHFNPRMIRWQSLTGGFASVWKHYSDFGTANQILEQGIDKLVVTPTPDAYDPVGGLFGYTSAPEVHDAHYKMIAGLIYLHKSYIPFVRRLIASRAFPLSRAQKINPNLLSLDLSTLKLMVENARDTIPPCITNEQANQLYTGADQLSGYAISGGKYALQGLGGIAGFALKAFLGGKS